MYCQPLLDLLGRYESDGAARAQGVPTGYDVVWSGIEVRHRPQTMLGKRLTGMTVREVLDWQDRIDGWYRSEAAGRYQFTEDTLRGLAHRTRLLDMLFDAQGQDRLAELRLRERGLDDFLAGRLGPEDFAMNIAQEWASLPVLARTKGRCRMVEAGESYYAGDGLNAAHCPPDRLRAALRACRAGVNGTLVTPPQTQPSGVNGAALTGGTLGTVATTVLAERAGLPVWAVLAVPAVAIVAAVWYIRRRRRST